MTREKKIFVGDVGTRIKVNTGLSLQGVDTILLYVEKPDGSAAITWAALPLGAVANGLVYYDTIAGDIDISGIYRLYAKTTYIGGKAFFGERDWFRVYNPSEG